MLYNTTKKHQQPSDPSHEQALGESGMEKLPPPAEPSSGRGSHAVTGLGRSTSTDNGKLGESHLNGFAGQKKQISL